MARRARRLRGAFSARDAHVDTSRLGPLKLRQAQGEHAVLQPRIDGRRVPLAAQLELAPVPGLDPKSIDVSVEKGLFTISGARTAPPEQRESGEVSVYAKERFDGRFRRVVKA